MKTCQKIYLKLNNTNEASKPLTKKIIKIKQPNQQSKWSISDFEIVKQLGKGKFGSVYAARQKKSDYIVALKRMCKEQLEENNFQNQVKRQIMIQSQLRHDNILRLFGYFWDQKYIYLILEYASGGQIYGILKNKGMLCQKDVSIIIRQVCSGLKYLQLNNIIHRDIKPQNLLLSFGTVKIADFGWSIKSMNKRSTLCGTLDYLAPEMIKGQNHDYRIDMWGIGILTYELYFGYPPFQAETYQQTYDRILYHQVEFPHLASDQLKYFIKQLLHKQSKNRMDINQALQSQFIKKYKHCQLLFDSVINS